MLEPRIPDTAEEMIEIRNAVKAMPTEAEIAVGIANDNHAIEIRQMRYEDAKRRDSIKDIQDKENDSLTLDAFKRFTVQIEQLEYKIDKKDSIN